MARTKFTTGFRIMEPGNMLQREYARSSPGIGGSARMCSKCKKPRGTAGGSNKNRIFVCRECRNAPAV